MQTLMSRSPTWRIAALARRPSLVLRLGRARAHLLSISSARAKSSSACRHFRFCIDWLPDGRLLIVSGRNGFLLRRELDASLVTHAHLTSLSEHAWNEIVVDGRGNAYINNIGFDFPGGDFATGIIALVTPDGSPRRVEDGVAFPNGMVVTPDNATLILAESYGKRLTAFDIALDGSLSSRRVWADLEGGFPDGISLDAENAVWYADVPNKRCVRVREGGEVLQTIDLSLSRKEVESQCPNRY